MNLLAICSALTYEVPACVPALLDQSGVLQKISSRYLSLRFYRDSLHLKAHVK